MMQKKPLLFESACIFSIVGSSIGFLGMLISTLFFSFVTEKIRAITDITAIEKLSPLYFSFLMAVYCVSLIGAIKLFQLKRVGLIFYLLAQAMIMILPVIWLGTNAFSPTNAIFTILFSGVYLSNYKLLKD
jgi:hypothetical protein